MVIEEINTASGFDIPVLDLDQIKKNDTFFHKVLSSFNCSDDGASLKKSGNHFASCGFAYLQGEAVKTLLKYTDATITSTNIEALSQTPGVKTTTPQGCKVATISNNVICTDDCGSSIPSGDSSTSMILRQLMDASNQAALEVSRLLEMVSSCREGRLSGCHENGTRIVARVLHYANTENRGTTPPHADRSGYTLLFSTAMVEFYHPNIQEWIKVPPPPESNKNTTCILIMGRYFTSPSSSSTTFHAPLHRVTSQPGLEGRKAVAICVNADASWDLPQHRQQILPSHKWWDAERKMRLFNEKVAPAMPTTSKLLFQDAVCDAEAFSQAFLKQHVPSIDSILQHWTLLQVIVDGPTTTSGAPSRPPCVEDKEYWNYQIEQYKIFLYLCKLHPNETQEILPPRSIHHVWMCHLLQPSQYRKDCMSLLDGRLLPHSNESFNLNGSDRFHELWEEVVGRPWSLTKCETSMKSDKKRQQHSKYLQQHIIRPLEVDFWKALDGLEAILDSVRVDCPQLCDAGCKFLQTTRSNYARFIAATAACPNLAMAPGTAMDLIWHAHQCDPVGYSQAMKDLPSFVNHNPCGKLNPPDSTWETATMEIWKNLYGQDIELPGQSIGCCIPMEARPTSLRFNSDNRCVMWFLDPERIKNVSMYDRHFLEGSIDTGCCGLPVQRSDAAFIIEKLDLRLSDEEEQEELWCTMNQLRDALVAEDCLEATHAPFTAGNYVCLLLCAFVPSALIFSLFAISMGLIHPVVSAAFFISGIWVPFVVYICYFSRETGCGANPRLILGQQRIISRFSNQAFHNLGIDVGLKRAQGPPTSNPNDEEAFQGLAITFKRYDREPPLNNNDGWGGGGGRPDSKPYQ